METDILEWIFKGLVTILGTGIIAWCSYIMNLVNKNANAILNVKDMVKAHELEDSRTYVQKTDFKETVVEIKETVKRVYERIDEILDKLK